MAVAIGDIQLTKEEKDALKEVAFEKYAKAVKREIAFWDVVRDHNGPLNTIARGGLPRAKSNEIFREIWVDVNTAYEASKDEALSEKRRRARDTAPVDKTVIEIHAPAVHAERCKPMCKKAGAPTPAKGLVAAPKTECTQETETGLALKKRRM